jgi:septal ring factor EnvC (AmiA/AmiB activator)
LDGLDSILTHLPDIGGLGAVAAVVVIALRMLARADNRYNAEVKAHEETQRELDDERDGRRRLEDELGEVKRKLAALEYEVARLKRRDAT